jgi:hypothetical protein
MALTAYNGNNMPIERGFQVSEDLSSYRYHFGTIAAAGTVARATGTNGGRADGVFLTKPTSGHATLVSFGEIKVVAGGSITAGDFVSVTVSATAQTATDQQYVMGIARTTAVSGATCTIFLSPQGYQPVSPTNVTTWTPTLNWTGTDPLAIKATYFYQDIGKFTHGWITIASSDGSGATNVTITMPSSAANVSVSPHTQRSSAVANLFIDTAWSDTSSIQCFVDESDSTLKFGSPFSLTDNKEFEMHITFSYQKA